jgi:predicted ATP-grasp superfamily ATP-dependent carboligase
MRPRALVLGIEHPRALAVVRSLGRRGIRVVGVERDPAARGLGSRYLQQIAMVEDGDARTLSALEAVAAAPSDLLIPTNDHFLSLVSRHWTRLARRFTLTVPPWDVLERLMDKPSCYRLADAAGLRTPRVVVPGDAAELDVAVSALDLGAQRYILSVRLPGDVPADPATGRMTTVAGEDAAAVRARCFAIAARTGEFPMIVEVVPGRSDRCVGVPIVVGRDQVPVVAYCVRRLQLRLYASDSRFVHPYERRQRVLRKRARRRGDRGGHPVRSGGALLRGDHRGVPAGRARRGAHPDQGGPASVRATSLSTALGLDVPAALYDVFTGVARPAATGYPERVAWMWPAWYLHTVGQNRGRASLARHLWAVARNAHRIRAFAYLSVRDPRPALADLASFAEDWRASFRRWLAGTVLPPTSMLGIVARRLRGPSGRRGASASPATEEHLRWAERSDSLPAIPTPELDSARGASGAAAGARRRPCTRDPRTS